MTGTRKYPPRTQSQEDWAVLRVFFLVTGVLVGVPCVMFVWCMLPRIDGSPLSAAAARRVVAERGDVLARALALTGKVPLPARDDPACQSVAKALGALDIRFEQAEGGPLVMIVWSRGGMGETYETQLTWVPEPTAARVRAGRQRLGEYFEYIDRGWWWVFW